MFSHSPCCYICLKRLVFYRTSIRSQSTTYTETPIKTYLEQLSEQYPLTENDNELDEIILCEECQNKINNYDLACLTAKNIENDLRDLLKKSKNLSIKREIMIKPEVIIKEESDNHVITDEEFDFGNDRVSSSGDELSTTTTKIKPKTRKSPTKRNHEVKLLKNDKKPKKEKTNSFLNHASKLANEVKHCSICSHQTKTVLAMQHHMERNHLNLKQEFVFRCKICRIPYKNKIDLDVHTEKHTKMIPNNPMQCVECEKVLKSVGSLHYHMTLHSGEYQRMYVCELCGREFNHRTSFRRHRMHHANIKTKECQTCGRLFSEASHLRRHLRTHTGEKPFKCTVCDRRFANKYNINSHMQKIHKQHPKSELKMHTCIVCNREFPQSLQLKEHLKRTHQLAIDD